MAPKKASAELPRNLILANSRFRDEKHIFFTGARKTCSAFRETYFGNVLRSHVEPGACGNQGLWNTGLVETKACGTWGLWKPRLVGAKACGNQGLWNPGLVETKACGTWGLWKPRLVEAKACTKHASTFRGFVLAFRELCFGALLCQVRLT